MAFLKDDNIYDVIVVGVGSKGASACYYLAASGLSVLGLEQFSIFHERGSYTQVRVGLCAWRTLSILIMCLY